MATFYRADCLEFLRRTTAASLDLLYFDPPFATTGNWWDDALPWTEIFTEAFRVLKPTGNLVIHCSVPFNYTLIRAAPRLPTYSWYWKKNTKTNFLNVKKQPLRQVEEILVWKMPKGTYYPQRVGTEKRTVSGARTDARYFSGSAPSKTPDVVVEGHYQTHLLEYNVCPDNFSTRPQELIELILKCYTKEGDTVCDLTCYEGISGVVARRLNRRWIGVDKYHFPKKLMT